MNRHYYKLRWVILSRDKFTCQYCGQSAPDVRLEVDHKLAKSEGGDDEVTNLVTSCYACNRGKTRLQMSVNKKGTRSPNRQQQALNIVKMHPTGISTKLLMKELGVARGNIDTIISRLRSKGFLWKTEEGKWVAANPQPDILW